MPPGDGKWRPRVDVDLEAGRVWLDGCELDILPEHLATLSFDRDVEGNDPRLTITLAITPQPQGWDYQRRREVRV